MSNEGSAFSKSIFFTGIAVSTLAFLAASLVPLLGAILLILTPLPILYYHFKTGRLQGFAIFFISLFLVAAVLTYFGSVANLPFLLLTGSLGLFISEIFRLNHSIERTVIYPVAAVLMLWCSFIVFHSMSAGQDPWRIVENYIGSNVQESVRLYAQLDLPAEQIDFLKENVKQISAFFANIFPALVLVTASFTVWLNILAAREIFQKNGMWCPDFGDLSRWKTPERLIWLLIAAVGMLLAPVAWVNVIGLNIIIVCLFAYLLQGLSIISFLFKTKNVHRTFRILCYFLIFAQQYLLLLLAAVGVFDLWIDFRRFIRPVTYSTS